MALELVTLRLIHVLFGAFWTGTMIFNALFLAPAMGEAGPDAAKVMAGIQRRRFMDVMPAVALVTILSGLWLLWRVSGGFSSGWMGSPVGMGYSTGAAFAIVAFVIGVGVLRPTMMRIGRLQAEATQAADETRRAEVLAAVPLLRRRSVLAGRVVALLLALATALMGVSRYL